MKSKIKTRILIMKKIARSTWRDKVFVGNIADIEIHEIALSNPPASDEELKSLALDIAKNGQLEPILISAGRNGKSFDGRNRINAMTLNGETEIKYCVAPVKMTLEEMKNYANSKETRRHKSSTQKVIQAWREIKNSGGSLTNKDAALKHGIPAPRISELNTLLTFIPSKDHDELINKLFVGKAFAVNKAFKSESIAVLNNYFKKIEKDKKMDDAHTDHEDRKDIVIKNLNKALKTMETSKEKAEAKTVDAETKISECTMEKQKLSKRIDDLISIVSTMSQNLNHTQKLSNDMKSIGAVPDFSPASADEIAAYHKQNPLIHPEDEVKPVSLESIDHEDVELQEDKIEEDQS